METNDVLLSPAVHRFTFRLLRALAASDAPTGSGGRNVIFSPYGLFAALALAASGAAPGCRGALREALGTDNLQPEVEDRAFAALSRRFADRETPDLTLSIATALWVRPGVTLPEGFAERAARCFGATPPARMDGDGEDRINRWAAAATRGLIDDMLPPGALAGADGALTNTVYFKGTWKSKFDPEQTRSRPFALPGGGFRRVPMMRRRKLSGGDHARMDGFAVARLPYRSASDGDGPALSLYLLLPDVDRRLLIPRPAARLPEVLASLTPGLWDRAVARLEPTPLDLSLPRLRLEWRSDRLAPVLSSLGFAPLFRAVPTPDTLSVGSVLHRARATFDEQGTEAVAVNTLLMRMTEAGPPPAPLPRPVRLRVDRPFVFLIADDGSGIPLFAGVVTDPAADA